MLNLTHFEHIEKLLSDKVEECLTLEYKRGLSNKEIAISVCAFTNSQGRQIVFGVIAQDRVPMHIECIEETGVEERIQNIVRTSVQPGLSYIEVNSIRTLKDNSKAVYVVTVPPSSEAPHMTEYRYYKRQGSESVPMENNEVLAAIVSRGRREGLLFEIRNNIKLAEETITFCEKLLEIPINDRQSVAFIPLYNDAWKSIIMSGLATLFKRQAFVKLLGTYEQIHEVNSLYEYTKTGEEALVCHTPIYEASWSNHGTYIPTIIRDKLTRLLVSLRELEKIL